MNNSSKRKSIDLLSKQRFINDKYYEPINKTKNVNYMVGKDNNGREVVFCGEYPTTEFERELMRTKFHSGKQYYKLDDNFDVFTNSVTPFI